MSELQLDVESLDLEANGVARHEGKVVFVRGALPGERVAAEIVRRKPKFDVAQTVAVLRESSARVPPRCPHFGVCGGCSMQHMDAGAQMAIKQRALEDQLRHIGKVAPQTWLAPISGPAWHYRHRARLSVRDVPKKGGVLVGFHERASSYVADMRECHVLPARVSDLLLPLRALVESLGIRRRVPQIEVAVGEGGEIVQDDASVTGDAGARGDSGTRGDSGARGGECIALVLRVLDAPSADDLERLRRFAAERRVEWWLQPKGPDSIELFCDADGRLASDGARSSLGYALAEFGVRMPFRPTDFTQVNARMNEVLVRRALRWLDPQPGERVADLFCGLGNFSLPIAARGAKVVGVEGNRALVERAARNAALNGLEERCEFRAADLFAIDDDRWRALGRFDRVLVDPPREGALEVVKAIVADAHRPRCIVYVSCNPATLARDAAILVHQGGFVLRAAGALNMFPHTSHVESMAVFDPPR
ncbi:MAG: 23S rRNA (uracil(1939)-C(5))-methyltransferase RlmD [Burkholderiaceae bacterium]|nr:23S rRNA (uracil(1939)-C(5))-methyltransferase RlmD [Burkholderiaceae bacterium]